MIARHKKPRHDLIVVLHSKSCDAAEKVVAWLLKTRDHRGGDSTVIQTDTRLTIADAECTQHQNEGAIRTSEVVQRT